MEENMETATGDSITLFGGQDRMSPLRPQRFNTLPIAEREVLIWGFPKIRSTILRVPIIGITVYWGLYWGPLIFGKLPYCAWAGPDSFSLAILRIDCLSMHYAASAQQNRRLTLRDALKLSQHTGGVNNIIMCRCLFIA